MPSRSVSYAPIADRYERVRGGERRARELASAVLPWLDGAALVCDVGAGTGIVTARLAGAGRRVVGFDLSPEMLAQAAHRLPGRVAVADGMRLPLRDAAVDAVVFVWVLHHVADLAATLAEACRVLRPGGRVVAASGVAFPVDDDIGPVFDALRRQLRPDRPDQREVTVAAARACGLRLVAEEVATVSFSASPNDAADAIEQRLYAYLWDVDDERWKALVQPHVDAMRALPDPDRRRDRQIRHPLWVFERT